MTNGGHSNPSFGRFASVIVDVGGGYGGGVTIRLNVRKAAVVAC